MAAQSNSVHTAAATSPDLIQLHMQAVNSLERCKAMLTANAPMYLFAQKFLAEAQQAVAALSVLDIDVAAH